MSIWNDMYGERSKEFVNGVIAGVEMYAVWKDGEQVVGIKEVPLKEVVKELKKDFKIGGEEE